MTIAVLWLIGTDERPALWRSSVIAMVLASVATVGLIVVPHLENKKEVLRVYSRVASFLRERIPQQDAVAVYAIGELAFDSRHPLIDTGGITRPGVVPYFNDPQGTLRWARAQGARYWISADQPEPDAVQVFSTPVPFLGWTFERSKYRSKDLVTVYRLAEK
jgi:hypothetical protein